jgi:hypothetical protein
MGLFYRNSGQPFEFTTLHGQTIQMYGQGIYAYETAFKAPIQRGTDAITLFFCVPLLFLLTLLYRRGSLRAAVLLTSLLAYLLYVAANLLFGVVFNRLFLVYVAFFSTNLFAFILAFQSISRKELAARLTDRAPNRGMAILMFVSGAGLLFAWLPDVLGGLASGWVPGIGSNTTEITYGIDLGVIAPAAVLAGIWLLRREPLGYLLGALLGNVLVIVGLLVVSQTVFQSLAGINLGLSDFIGKTASFMLLSLVSAWLSVRFLRSISSPEPIGLLA